MCTVVKAIGPSNSVKSTEGLGVHLCNMFDSKVLTHIQRRNSTLDEMQIPVYVEYRIDFK